MSGSVEHEGTFQDTRPNRVRCFTLRRQLIHYGTCLTGPIVQLSSIAKIGGRNVKFTSYCRH